MNADIENIYRLVENLGVFLGSDCEIAVHDFSNGYESTVVKIVNGHVSGRSVGSPPTTKFLDALEEQGGMTEDMPLYFNRTEDGVILKSCTTFIKDKKNNVIGAICLNMDITAIVNAADALNKLTDYNSSDVRNEIYVKDMDELMEYYMTYVENHIGKPAKDMSKREKLKALKFLDDKGVLKMGKANVRLCQFFDISKFTLYNYLDEIRSDQYPGRIDEITDDPRRE